MPSWWYHLESYLLSERGLRVRTGRRHFKWVSAVKWQPVGRTNHSFNSTPRSAADGSPAQEQYKFSVVHPGRRGNPILASLTRTRLEIAEHCASTDHNHDASGMDLTSTVEASNESGNLCTSKEVDDSLKTLIQATAIWIALSLGWCVNFNLNRRSLCPGQLPHNLKASNLPSQLQSP